MATERSAEAASGRYVFAGSDRNVYAEYLHVTFVRKLHVRWLFTGLMFIALAIFGAVWLMDFMDIVSLPEVKSNHSSVLGRSTRALMPFVAPWGVPLLAFFALLFLVPQTVAGCRFGNFLWARVYWGICRRRGLESHRIECRGYLDSLERHPMQASVGKKSVRVVEPDGRAWTLALRDVRRAYRGNGLVVLETGENLPPKRTAVLDTSGMSRRERRAFHRFLDGNLPPRDRCKCYYLRLAEPAVSEVVPDKENE